MARLVVDRLSHHFAMQEVLHEISFTLKQNEVIAVVGPSGGGKTTLLHLCAGLLDVIQGRIENSFQTTAFAFQDARLLPWQTMLDNIAFGLKASRMAKAQRHQRATELALNFGLELDDLSKFPKDLSGGMRQRVAFARALAIEPELLFLDEPFSALDIGLKQELQTILMNRVAEQSLSILFITHDLMEAVRLSDHVLLLSDEGKMVTQFAFSTPQLQRDDQYVYQETAKLLAHPQVMQTFELSLGGKHGS